MSAQTQTAYNSETSPPQQQKQNRRRSPSSSSHRPSSDVGAVQMPTALTPLPSWKLYENPFYEGLAAAVVAAAEAAAAAAAAVQQDDTVQGQESMAPEKQNLRTSSVSARKLAASLWEGLHNSHQSGAAMVSTSPRSHLQSRPSSVSTSDSPHSSSKVSRSRSPRPPTPVSPPLKTITLMRPRPESAPARQLRRSVSPSSSSQVSERASIEQLPYHPSDGYLISDSALITSPRGYSRSSSRSRGSAEDKQIKESSPRVSDLSDELSRALSRVQELEYAQLSARNEVDGLLKRFADEITILRCKEQEKIQDAIYSLAEDLQNEQIVRRKLEVENKKLCKSLSEASKTVVKVERDLEKERKARKLMEEVCEELAREIGEDKAEVEELKREQSKVREEIEEEHRTIQMTEAWREERVQMKLAEAKIELEERCIAFEKLKIELDAFLDSLTSNADKFCIEKEGRSLREAMEKVQHDTRRSIYLLEDGDRLVQASSRHHQHNNEQQSCENGDDEEEDWQTDFNDGAKNESDYDGSEGNLEGDSEWDNGRNHNRVGQSQNSSFRGDMSDSDEDCNPLHSREHSRANNERQDSDWSADCEDDYGNTEQAHLASSGSFEDEEDGTNPQPSSEFTRMYKLSRRIVRNARSTRSKQTNGGKFQQYHDSGREESVSPANRVSEHPTEAESEDSPISRSSQPHRHRSSAMDFMNGDWASVDGDDCNASQGRRASMGSSGDWPKMMKSNSLQAQLLLEDRMSIESETQNLWPTKSKR